MCKEYVVSTNIFVKTALHYVDSNECAYCNIEPMKHDNRLHCQHEITLRT